MAACDGLLRDLAGVHVECERLRDQVRAEIATWEHLFDAMPGASLLTDDAGVIRDANRAAAAILNTSAKHLKDRQLLVFSQDRAAFSALLQRLARGGEHVCATMVLRPRERKATAVNVIAVPLSPDHAGGWVWFFSPNTDSQKASRADSVAADTISASNGFRRPRTDEGAGSLDAAIAGAVTMYARESQQARLDEAKERDNERVGFLVHELRNLVNTAIVAFEVLKTGQVNFAGSTGAVLDRSLMGLHDLIARSLDEVRLTRAVNKTRMLVTEFIDDVAAAARLTANARGISLIVRIPQDGLAIEADQHILSAVVGNLLQNALKFTRPDTTVTLTVSASADRVIIDVEDECGGLPGAGNAKERFPSFAQQGADRTGLGIGLAFSRWGAEANGGRLYARNLPERGCVFTVDLPRSLAPVVAHA